MIKKLLLTSCILYCTILHGSIIHERVDNLNKTSDYANVSTLEMSNDSIIVSIEGIFCEGQCYSFRGTDYCEEGIFNLIVEQESGIDTIFEITLTIKPNVSNNISTTICEGEILFVGDTPISTEGAHTIEIKTESNCDSTIILDLQFEECTISQGFNTRANPKCYNTYDGEYLFEIGNGTQPFSYEVTGLNGGLVKSGTIERLNELEVIENIRADTYIINVTNYFDDVGIIVFTLENPEKINPGIVKSKFSNANVSCNDSNDGSIFLQPTGGFPDYTFLWSDGSETSILENLSSGTYQVTITDLALCEVPLEIEIVSPLPLTASTDTTNPNCDNPNSGSILSPANGGTPPYTYILNSEIENELGLFEELSSGEYAVDITDANGCQTETNIILRAPHIPEVAIIGDSVLCLGETIELSALVNDIPIQSIKWNRIDSLVSLDSLQQIISPVSNTEYTITVWSTDDCSTSVSHAITINSSQNFYAPNIFNPKMPNQNQFFRITGSKEVSRIRDLKIFNRWGQQVYQEFDHNYRDLNSGWDGKVNGTFTRPGVYFWKAEIEFLDGQQIIGSGNVSIVF